MKSNILILMALFPFLTLKAQNESSNLKPIDSKVKYQTETNKPELLHAHLDSMPRYSVHIGPCLKGAINNPIFIVDGLSIIDSTCNSNMSSLNVMLIKKIEAKSDTIFDTSGVIRGSGLIIIFMNDTAYKSIKLINELSFGWTLLHPLTKYQLNNKLLTDSEKISLLSACQTNSIIRVETNMDKDFPDGLIKIKTK